MENYGNPPNSGKLIQNLEELLTRMSKTGGCGICGTHPQT